MPTTGTINTQQILQMGTHTEKLQHTLQQLPTTTAQQMQDEQVSAYELKKNEVQDPEQIDASDPTKSEGKRRREIRIRNKPNKKNELEESASNSTQENSFNGVSHQGQRINLTV